MAYGLNASSCNPLSLEINFPYNDRRLPLTSMPSAHQDISFSGVFCNIEGLETEIKLKIRDILDFDNLSSKIYVIRQDSFWSLSYTGQNKQNDTWSKSVGCSFFDQIPPSQIVCISQRHLSQKWLLVNLVFVWGVGGRVGRTEWAKNTNSDIMNFLHWNKL